MNIFSNCNTELELMNAIGQAFSDGKYSKLEILEFAEDRRKEFGKESCVDLDSNTKQKSCEHFNLSVRSFTYPHTKKALEMNEHIVITKDVFESTNIIHSDYINFII